MLPSESLGFGERRKRGDRGLGGRAGGILSDMKKRKGRRVWQCKSVVEYNISHFLSSSLLLPFY